MSHVQSNVEILTMLKPKPVPGAWESSWENGWNIRFARNPGLIPEPVSVMLRVIAVGAFVFSVSLLERKET